MNWYLLGTYGLAAHLTMAYACISPERQRRADRYTHADGRKEQIAAGLLERHALGSAADVRTENAYGKPLLSDGRDYSLSHTPGAVALCVGAMSVGIDIERLRTLDDRVIRRCFLPEEQGYIYTSRDMPAAFTELFTRKEAVIKALGKGFAEPLTAFSVLPMPDAAVRADGKTLFVHTERVGEWYLSLASESDAPWTGQVLTVADVLPIRPLR